MGNWKGSCLVMPRQEFKQKREERKKIYTNVKHIAIWGYQHPAYKGLKKIAWQNPLSLLLTSLISVLIEINLLLMLQK